MNPTPYIFFNGQCADAIAFYVQALGATVAMKMLASEMPPSDEFVVPQDKMGWIMHATLNVGTGQVMMSDNFMETTSAMDGCSVMLSYPTAAEAKAVFDKLSDGAEIIMPWSPTFWSAGFGQLRDKFGACWMVGCDEMPEAAATAA